MTSYLLFLLSWLLSLLLQLDSVLDFIIFKCYLLPLFLLFFKWLNDQSFQRNLSEHEQVLQVVLLQFLLCLYSCGSESLKAEVFLAVLNFLFTLYILLKRHTPAVTSPGKLVLIGGLSVLASMNAEFKFSPLQRLNLLVWSSVNASVRLLYRTLKPGLLSHSWPVTA